MKPTCTLHTGDALTVLRTLPADSVHCCVTSPPYWGLRDYGTAQWSGGSPDCNHVKAEIRTGKGLAQSEHSTRGGAKKIAAVPALQFRGTCEKCGAKRTDLQLGLEHRPGTYVGRLTAVFRELRRVLRADGTVWLNLGDSYASGGNGGGGSFMDQRGAAAWKAQKTRNGWKSAPPGLKHKDLVGIPWRVAFSLQEDGWYLRSDIIWAKPNPMPESVTDRPTKSHEYLFLLSKSPSYYYDHAAIAEPQVDRERARRLAEGSRGVRTVYKISRDADHFITPAGKNGCVRNVEARVALALKGTRNRRTVWTVPTSPYRGAHFATFPPKLIEPCILAGCPEGGVVLDPFNGAGTTGLVALQHGRSYIGIELNPEYVAMTERRLAPVLHDIEHDLFRQASA